MIYFVPHNERQCFKSHSKNNVLYRARKQTVRFWIQDQGAQTLIRARLRRAQWFDASRQAISHHQPGVGRGHRYRGAVLFGTTGARRAAAAGRIPRVRGPRPAHAIECDIDGGQGAGDKVAVGVGA